MTTAATASPAVDVLRAAIAAALTASLPDVVLLDAGDLTQAFSAQSVTLPGAWDPETEMLSTADAISTDITEKGAGRSLIETTTVAGVIYAGSGDQDLPTHRANANAILSVVRNAARSVTTVGSSSAVARIIDHRWQQAIDDNGAGVIVAFDIAVTVLP